jgi:hypothetical protein
VVVGHGAGSGFLSFKGRRFGSLEGDYAGLHEKFEIGGADYILVSYSNGNSCPGSYHIARVTSSGVAVSPRFGTCSEQYVVQRRGQSIVVTMPGFKGPFEGRAAQTRAARQTFVYVYTNGALTENGRAVR